MDPVVLARTQFGVTIMFHFLYVPISIGLAWLLVIIEGLAWRRKSPEYDRMGRLFGKLLGINFAIGVATGLVMVLQFGTNWARYSVFVGDVFAAPLAAEATFAFFMESTFIAIYLFARDRVSKGFHWFSIVMVAIGTTLSAFCILVANAWQQTPAGYAIVDGKAVLTDLYAAVFNPSTMPTFFHTLDATLTSGAFFVAGICAYLLYRNQSDGAAKKVLQIALAFGFIVSVLELFPFGHWSAKSVAQYQPAKLAAFEGLYETETDAPLVVFGIPGKGPHPELKDAIEIPGMLSWIAFGNSRDEVLGLDRFKPEDRPPLRVTFITFHLMVALGTLFILVTALGLLLWWRKRLINTKPFLLLLMLCIPLPVIGCELGWMASEMGRQPWVVYGLLRTQNATSLNLNAGEILFSLLLFSGIYAGLFTVYITLICREIKKWAVGASYGS
jgi:cytochrome d ubiquinol oxidase subunit I